ncbi:MAG: hypothetical protein WBG01_01855 [Bacteroidota bacterium]|jgi:hypothetical protein
MLKEVHQHVVSELQQSARTDTVFVVTAVLFNLIVLGINWGVASGMEEGGHPPENDWILALLIIGTVCINTFAVRALLTGRDTRGKLLAGLLAMYKDNEVDRYYDATLLDAYGARYKLFVAVLVVLALISIVVPLLERFLG